MILKLEKCSKISTFLLSQCSKFYKKEHKTVKLLEEPLCWHPLIGQEGLVIDIGIIYFYHVLFKKCLLLSTFLFKNIFWMFVMNK